MARKKDLGGLAALAGLAYMASRDKASKDSAPSTPSASSTAPAARADTGGDFIEAGSGPIGDFMSEKEPGWESGTAPSRSTSSRPAATSSKSKTATESKSKAPVLGLNDPGYGDAPEAKAAPVDVTKLSLAERAKLSRERARSDGTKTDSRSVNERMRDSLGMKKGGSVKGWGIARGSRKAKTY